MSFVCFVRAAELGVIHLFIPSSFRALQDEGRLHANKRVVIPLSREMKANIMDPGLLMQISNCEVDPVFALWLTRK